MKRFLLLFLFLSYSFVSFSQEKPLGVQQRWMMNDQLMDMLEMYERFSGMERNSDVFSFASLFRSDSVPVWCDYISCNEFGKSIPVAEYLKYSKELEYRSVKLKNLKKGEYKYSNGRWHIMAEFDKQVKYEDSQFLFSTLYPELGGDFHIVLDCVWIEEDNSFRIADVTGSENPASTVPKGRFNIVQQKNEIDKQLLYKGKPIPFNDDGFAIVQDTKGIEFRDDDVKIKTKLTPGEGRYDIVSFSLVPTRMRARTYFSLYPSGSFAIETEDCVKPSSTGWEAGAQLGYALSLGKSTKFVPYIGFGFASSGISLSASDINYQYELADASGDVYERKYHIESATEGIRMRDFVISGIGSLEQIFGRIISIGLDLGVKLYLNSKFLYEPYTISGTVTDRSGGQPFTLGSTAPDVGFVFPIGVGIKQYSVSVVGKLGIDVNIAPGLYVYGRAGYEYGLSNPVLLINNNDLAGGSEQRVHKWFVESSHIYPVIYYGGDDVIVRTFLGAFPELHRAGFLTELGFRFKFGFKK